MTVMQIREVGYYYFSRYGYEGTSLSQIAKDVGIKTPSLYAHFKSKKEIFFSCLLHALESDLDFFQKKLKMNNEASVEATLYNMLVDYEERARTKVISMFCLRTLYSPPHAFKEQLFLQTNEYLKQIGKLLYPWFERAKNEGNLGVITIDEAVEAYLCLFDGLVIEFMYAGSERFRYRLQASWGVFTQSLFK